MKTSNRAFLPRIASLLLILTLLIIAGCKPQSQVMDETVPTLSVSPTTAPVGPVSELSDRSKEVVFEIDHISSGLTMDSGGDVDTEVVTVGEDQEQAFRTGNGRVLPSADGNKEEDWYMQFKVADYFIYEGSPTTHVRIEVEYLDDGADQFNIQYDAVSAGAFSDGRFKESNVVTKSGSGEFKTAIFTLSDAYFANRDNNADFRISDHSDGAETIRRVSVTLLTGDVEMVMSPTETPLSSPELLSPNQADKIFFNGVILTMESDIVSAAIAIKDERILEVGSYEEVMAFTGSGTTQIDLEGRTLMPGFVDPHGHLFASRPGEMEDVQSDMLAKGITTYAEITGYESNLHDLIEFERAGNLRLRLSLYPNHVDNCGNLLGSWYLEDFPATRQPGAKLQIPGVKIFNDGGSCNAPARSFKVIGGDDYGNLYFSVEELSAMIIEVQNNGYQAAIHSLGDRAIEVTQKAIAVALGGGPNTYHHRIEHNGLLPDELLSAYTEYDIVALIFGSFPACFFTGSGKFNLTPEEFEDWEWRWRALIDENPTAHIAWHSDAPVLGPQDPFLQLYGFMTRIQVREDGSVCEPPDWAITDLLTVEEALPMMTIEAAYALRRESEIGSLKAGKLADLIVLSDNPLEVDHEAILDIQVLMTMVGGNVEYCAQGHEEICP